MALGAGTFKPVISGTIARVHRREEQHARLRHLLLVDQPRGVSLPPHPRALPEKQHRLELGHFASAIGTGAMLLPSLLFYKEPPRPKTDKSVVLALAAALEIILSPPCAGRAFPPGRKKPTTPCATSSFSPRSLLVPPEKRGIAHPDRGRGTRRQGQIAVSPPRSSSTRGFWILYFQMFDSVLWYVQGLRRRLLPRPDGQRRAGRPGFRPAMAVRRRARHRDQRRHDHPPSAPGQHDGQEPARPADRSSSASGSARSAWRSWPSPPASGSSCSGSSSSRSAR